MTFRKRYILILTVNTIISIMFMGSIPFFTYRYLTPREYKNTGLVSQENFHTELYARLTGDEKLLEDNPRGTQILMILTNDRGVIYNSSNKDIDNMDINSALHGLAVEYDSRRRYRTETFLYGEDYGLFVFSIDRKTLIGTVRLYTIPITLLLILLFIIIPSIINFALLYTLKKAFSKLEVAADRVSRGDFEVNLVRKGKDELYSFYKSFNRMGRILKENRDQKARLLMSITHDLKTPLTSMKGYIEAFRDNLVPKGKEDRYFNIISDKTCLLEDRINNLIDFSKIETSEWKKTFSNIALYDFLKNIVESFKEDCFIYNRSFTFKLDISKKLNIEGDNKLLMRAIENLLENAKRYTDSDGEISLRAYTGVDSVNIIIEDNGKGIPEQSINYLFEPFYKVDKGRNSKGMGMGLYTVKYIIESHEGSITCESKLGDGSRFILNLPCPNNISL